MLGDCVPLRTDGGGQRHYSGDLAVASSPYSKERIMAG